MQENNFFNRVVSPASISLPLEAVLKRNCLLNGMIVKRYINELKYWEMQRIMYSEKLGQKAGPSPEDPG